MPDNHAYAFNKTDAQELVQLIGGADREFPMGKVRRLASGAKLVFANNGITARSGATAGSATCTEYKLVGSTLTTNVNTLSVYNIDANAIPSGQYLLAVRESISGKWIAQHPGIIDLRLSGSNLQYTMDGTTWTTWTTAATCV